jgi:cytoskeletal protein CcmA (bactofilin family)
MHVAHSRRLALLALIALCAPWFVQVASAASSWNPTLLVNTESFQVIDEGDGSSNIEIRFGQTLNEKIYYDRGNNRFQFTRSVNVGGSVTATGAVTAKSFLSGAALRVNGLAEIHGALTVTGAIRGDSNLTLNDDLDSNNVVLTFGSDGTSETITWQNTNDRFEITDDVRATGYLSGAALRIDGLAEVNGALAVTGAIRTDDNLTINDDRTAADAVLTFGNNTANQTLKFLNTSQKFEFSTDTRTLGNMSGRTLTVDGNVTIHGVTYSYPTSQGGANTFLKNNGAGTLTWATPTVGNSSGNVLFLEPSFPNALYFNSGSVANSIGTLAYAYDETNKRPHYRWQTTKTTNQIYWISTRVHVPKNFFAWDSLTPLKLRYRASGAYLDVRMIDAAGTNVPLTGGARLTNTSTNWTVANITGPQSTGTYTAGSGVTIFIKATSSGATSGNTKFADVGGLEVHWGTTSP